MRPSRGRIGALISLASMIAGSTAALSCGFEDSKSAGVARGVLNWAFPDSLHVITAVWQAQAEGVISRDQTPAAAKTLVGYQKATEKLAAFRDGLAAGLDEHEVPALAMVLLGPVLWTRFQRNGLAVDMAAHVVGPAAGDAVIVTDETVVVALVDGRLTPRAARELGLLRLYGPAASVAKLMNWLDRWPEKNASGTTRVHH